MYKSFSSEQYKQKFGLPADYRVDGVLCYGTLYEDKIIATLEECLAEMDIDIEIYRLADPFLRFIRELRIGDKVLWFMIGYGGAWISEYIHFACLFDSKKNILVGSCGGLKQGISYGDFIVPVSSFGQESSARMYNREGPVQYSDKELSHSLMTRLGGEGNTIWQGPMVTCQAMIAETAEDVKEWSDAGYYGVEMEAATVFAVSNHFNVPSAASVYVSDNLIENHTTLSQSFAEESNTRQQRQHHQIRAALEELLS